MTTGWRGKGKIARETGGESKEKGTENGAPAGGGDGERREGESTRLPADRESSVGVRQVENPPLLPAPLLSHVILSNALTNLAEKLGKSI